MTKEEAINKINQYAAAGMPFLFMADFKCEKNEVILVDEVDPAHILYDINGKKNVTTPLTYGSPIALTRNPVSFSEYNQIFKQVQNEISAGNTYLLNLTFPTEVDCREDLRTIFFASQAKYKLLYKNQFVVFSPEKFIQINQRKISCFPMKGTIDADLPNAHEQILNSKKEMAEHSTIVDLIRNDLSIYARNVMVEEFRYIDEVKTSEKHLLQVSSIISGTLHDDFDKELGNLIYSLLPAGSICGAPKKRTLEIIETVEIYERGFYTGVVGFFDGENFDSGVMIRFIENRDGELVYKSGGGIHALSDAEEEYEEMIDKVYVPLS